ncbi:hypothetical protein [Microcoleus sp. bin38.metabat.b11b12b14.051]|uniref:hypothetical protein n=1 Tax=Microcoleus sp. bin38.metabat.b11b12b14.051 TaxID=2742709 RepID=UPI0026000EAC|nr:hypothetical protein [Microcoleus sp. bin38.metabat.b11b12b14.051]
MKHCKDIVTICRLVTTALRHKTAIIGQLAVGSWQLAVGSCQLSVGSWQLALSDLPAREVEGSRRVGSWQLTACAERLARPRSRGESKSCQLAVGKNLCTTTKETGFFWGFSVGSEVFREKPGFWPPVRSIATFPLSPSPPLPLFTPRCF